MERYQCKGAITVFLSLVSVLFLALACTLVESARIQGARAQAAAVTDLGLFSVFAEYEKELLDTYDFFALDGAYGTGDFQPERLALRLGEFMKYNADPGYGLQGRSRFSLFPMETSECQIPQYTLATDEKGSAFYQQVVGNLKENLGGELLLKYQKSRQEARKQQEDAESYERNEKQAEEELKNLEEKQMEEEKKQQTNQGAEETGQNTQEQEVVVVEEEGQETQEAEVAEEQPEVPPVENPLDEIKKIKEMGILGLVVKDVDSLSKESIEKSSLPSKRALKKGNLPVEKKQSGAAADGLFQEYLLDHFGNMVRASKGSGLSYQIEYILMGKDSDLENLKGTVNRILLMREGSNFLYAVRNPEMQSQAGALALAIGGAAPIPGLVSALKYALLLAWAYGESLLDVRTLLAGGKVPLLKGPDTWKLSLENLGRVTQMLEECDTGGGEGQDYEDYLRALLFVCGKENYPLRAMDLMESGLGKNGNKADSWVVRAYVNVKWRFPALFLRMPEIFLGIPEQGSVYEVSGSFGY